MFGAPLFSEYAREGIVYFSVLSAFMIFDNLFIRIEFFFVFILLYFAKYKFTWGKA
jgi:hypothetical protein